MLDEHFAELEGAREESTLILRNFYKSEEIFLDMFEDEWREMNKRPINVEYVMSDASLLLPPTGYILSHLMCVTFYESLTIGCHKLFFPFQELP